MPPKKKDAGASKKTQEKQKAKVIEDKTFGLKNKKGAKQQKFVQHVQKQVTNKFEQKGLPKKTDEPNKKLEKKKEAEELNALFKPVTKQQQVAKGVDPKSVVCAFYKQGTCQKGDKCKFSHDLSLERKGEKRSAYYDERSEKEADTMDQWDESKLEEVINKKHGEKEKKLPATAIICKFFLTAVEAGKYGWFWECPNGEKCHYRHALPPGFVLKKDKKKMDEQKEDDISLEELIESERKKLTSTTKCTLETFLAWKKRKREERAKKDLSATEKKKAAFQEGKMYGISGREMFMFKPEMAADDDDDEGGVAFERPTGEGSDDEGEPVEVHEITDEMFLPTDVDNSGTVAQATKGTKGAGDVDGIQGASGGADVDAATGGGAANIDEDLFKEGDVPVDEELFMDDDVGDLDEELEQLGLDDIDK